MSISIYNQGDGLGLVAFLANQVCVTSNSVNGRPSVTSCPWAAKNEERPTLTELAVILTANLIGVNLNINDNPIGVYIYKYFMNYIFIFIKK
jgi:hypothetical protein